MLKKDNETTLQALKDLADTFSLKRDWSKFHNPKDLAIGIVTEGSELLALFRFKSNEEINKMLSDESSVLNIKHELADVLFFVLRFSQITGIELTEAFLDKMKLNEMRYPVNKSMGSNKKYSEL
jgi:NTP pyrophosphatase (non-canonical NTP hydrolase)